MNNDSNLDSASLNRFQSNLNNELSIKDQQIKKEISNFDKKFKTLLQSSNIKDDNIVKMLQELNNSSGDYKKRIETLTKSYIAEQKLTQDEQSKVTKLLESMDDKQSLQKQEANIARKKEAKENPLSAFTHAFDKFKETKSIKESATQLGTSLKDSLNFTNLSKAILHGAGVLLDNPALNILATELKHNTEVKEEEVEKAQAFIDTLNEKPSKEDTPSAISNTREALQEESGIYSNILKVLEDTYQDHGALIENLHRESKQSNLYFEELINLQKETLFFMRDASDDNKKGSKGSEVGIGIPALDDAEQSESGLSSPLLDNIGSIGGRDKGKSKKGKSFGSKLANVGKMGLGAASGMVKFLPVIGLLATAGLAIKDGIDGFNKTNETFGLRVDQQATASEQFASTLGGVAEGLSFGLLSSKDIATKLENGLDNMKDIFSVDSIANFLTGTSKQSANITKDLETKGIVDTSMLGNSRINNWDEVKKLSMEDVIALKKYDDWSSADEKELNDIIASKATTANTKAPPPPMVTTSNVSVPPNINIQNITKEAENKSVATTIPEPIKQEVVSTGNNTPAPVVVNNNQAPASKERKIDKFNMDNNDLVTVLRLNGIGSL